MGIWRGGMWRLRCNQSMLISSKILPFFVWRMYWQSIQLASYLVTTTQEKVTDRVAQRLISLIQDTVRETLRGYRIFNK